MFTCHCPNCGKELAVPRWLPRTVTCENCHTKSIVPYDQDHDFNKYNAIAKSKVKLNDFRTAHPGFTKGIGIAGIVALAAGTFYLSLKDDNASLPQLTESTNELPEDQNRSLAIDAGQDDSIAADTDQDDSIFTEVLSEPDHRKYAPRNPDDYETVMYSLGMIMVRLKRRLTSSKSRPEKTFLRI